MTPDAPSPRSAPEAGGVGAPLLLPLDLGPAARGVFTTRLWPGDTASHHDPYRGLNLAAHVGDSPEHVQAARRALELALGLGQGADGEVGTGVVAWMDQVHSAVVATAYRAGGRGDVPRADALILDRADPRCEGVAGVGVLVADCVPLLLASQDGRVVAAVHAGRRGMLDGVVAATLDELERRGVGAGRSGARGSWRVVHLGGRALLLLPARACDRTYGRCGPGGMMTRRNQSRAGRCGTDNVVLSGPPQDRQDTGANT